MRTNLSQPYILFNNCTWTNLSTVFQSNSKLLEIYALNCYKSLNKLIKAKCITWHPFKVEVLEFIFSFSLFLFLPPAMAFLFAARLPLSKIKQLRTTSLMPEASMDCARLYKIQAKLLPKHQKAFSKRIKFDLFWLNCVIWHSFMMTQMIIMVWYGMAWYAMVWYGMVPLT